MSHSPSLSLALGGGGARGLAHIAVFEILDELKIEPKHIAGTSIGAIFGAAFANGLCGKDIREITKHRFSNPTKVAQTLWKMRRRRTLPKFSITDVDPIAILETFIGDLIPNQFEDLKIPLSVITADFYSGRETVIRNGDLRRAIAASIAIPVLFTPVTIEGRLQIDGGFVNPLPFDQLEDADISLAVDVTGGPMEPETKLSREIPMPGFRELVFGSTQMAMQSITNAKLASSCPDVLLCPPIKQFAVLDFLKVHEILDAVDTIRDDIKRQIADVLEQH